MVAINRNFAIVGAFSLAVGMLVGGLIGHFATPTNPTMSEEDELIIEKYNSLTADQWQEGIDNDVTGWIIDQISKKNIQENLRFLSLEPHIAASPRDNVLAEHIRQKFVDSGFDWTEKLPQDIYLSRPDPLKPNKIYIRDGSDSPIFNSTHREKFDGDDLAASDTFVDAFNAYTPAGEVNSTVGEGVVYVNYGRVEDFELLTKTLGIDVTNRIAMMRYGAIYRGNKIENAYNYGSVGAILFSDPYDVAAEGEGNVYPDSWWLPDTGMQRGSAFLGDGDPRTPGWPSTAHAHRIDTADVEFLKIPAQPIGYADARKILEKLDGLDAPKEWQGGLTLPNGYKLGPVFLPSYSDHYVQLVTNNFEDTFTSYNVLGSITGAVEPDRYVLLGNHRDAWGYGASDPSSGTAQMLETARVLGELRKTGWRPRRTIVFCSWGAEEYGLIGSTEFVEENVDKLQARAVAYLNTDTCSTGPVLEVPASPLLWDMVEEVTKMVPGVVDPTVSVWDELSQFYKQHHNANAPIMHTLGAGSDYAHFVVYAGVPAMDIWFRRDRRINDISTYPSYHTGFETFDMVSKYNDPGFKFTQGCGRVASLSLKRLADSPVLPFILTRFPEKMAESLEGFDKSGTKQKILDFYPDYIYLEEAVANLTEVSKRFHSDITNKTFDPVQLRQVNDQLMKFEQIFLIPAGLPGRPVTRHAIFAPSKYDNYASAGFPGISDLTYDYDKLQGDKKTKRQEEIRRHVSLLIIMTNRAAAMLTEVHTF